MVAYQLMTSLMKDKKTTNITMIAERTGFSPMTVSRALRGLGSVRAETRAKILETARRLGYRDFEGVVFRPTKRNRDLDHRLNVCTIGRMEPEGGVMQELESRFQGGLRGRLQDYGGSVTRLDLSLSLDQILESIKTSKAHALVLRCHLPESWTERIRRQVPVVSAVSLDFSIGVDCIFMNEARAATLISNRLREKGHRHVAWFGLLDLNDDVPYGLKSLSEQITFFDVGAVRYAHWNLLVNYLPGPKDASLVLIERDHRSQSLQEVLNEGVDRILTMQPLPTAVVVASDIMGRQLVELLESRKIPVPERISVISYGATKVATHEKPGLAGIRVPLDEVGRTIPEIIERRLARPDAPAISIMLEPTFVEGASLAHCR